MLTHYPIEHIAGLSRCNARQSPASGDELAEMIDAIRAADGRLLQPLLVRKEDDEIRVLDGGRRWAALRALAASDEKVSGYEVPCVLFDGDDEQAAEASLISFVQRRDLHPVDEFERFIDLRDRFHLEPEAIARRTGKSLAFVRSRLRLARLAPEVRDAWRAGKLRAEAARAFALAPDEAAQRETLERLRPRLERLTSEDVADEFETDSVRGDAPQARFVGKDAYLAAGGDLDEQLFEEPLFLDGALLRRLADEKLRAAGEAVCAEEGWGFVLTPDDPDFDWKRIDWAHQSFQPDYTPDERARLDAIHELDDEGVTAEIDAEFDEINRRAELRAVPAAERARFGVIVEILRDGKLSIERGAALRPLESAAEYPPQADRRSGAAPKSDAGAEATAAAPPREPPEAIGKSLRAVLDDAAKGALADGCAASLTLAMIVVVAALGSQYGASSGFHIASNPLREAKSELLREISGLSFEKALAAVEKAHLDDACVVPVAFAEAVGGCFFPHRQGNFDAVKILIAVAGRHVDMRAHLHAHTDYEALFKAMTKDAVVDAVRDMRGDAEANRVAGLKKPVLAEFAAAEARRLGWTPPEFASCLPETPPEPEPARAPSLAEAMQAAIEADEDADAGETSEPPIERFLRDACNRGDAAGETKAASLFAAFASWWALRSDEPCPYSNFKAFGKAVAGCGVESHRRKDGVYYLAIELLDVSAAEAA